MTKQKIGFIGIGVMGKSMAGNLLKAGFPVTVYNRTKEKANDLLEMGAKWADSPAAIAKEVDVVISIVGYPKDVEETYLGENGVLANGHPGQIVMDMTTSKPSLAIEIYNAAKEKGIDALDAPVTGGDIGARDAKLSIMVGGEEEAFNKVKPILDAMGTNIVYQGKAGSGQHTKMANQIGIASCVLSVCEAIIYAEKAGLDPQKVLQNISTGSAGSWQMTNMAPRMLSGNFEPGFFIKHFVKDMNIALEESEKMGVVFPGLSKVKSMYDELIARGEENSGTQALYKYWK
ncbi:MAG: oxidoreductase [Bacillales bacterium]|jgi:3-hydroxyisobutyrate dehydrogenase|nr:oxidoreductase [Bacillales bacterium]